MVEPLLKMPLLWMAIPLVCASIKQLAGCHEDIFTRANVDSFPGAVEFAIVNPKLSIQS